MITAAAIETLDPENPVAEAVAWKDGRIVAVGDTESVLAAAARAPRLHLPDGVVVPGLVDAHMHPFMVEETRGADLTECRDLDDLRRELAVACESLGADDWLLGWGLEYGPFTGQAIEIELVDDVIDGRPMMLTLMDGHTALASRRALEMAGVREGMAFEEEAEIVYRDGRPTGELREIAAMMTVRDVIPELSADELRRQSVVNLRRFNAQGLTGAHVMMGDPSALEFVAGLESEGLLTMRLLMPLWQKPDTGFDEMRSQLGLLDASGRRWRCGFAKFFLDGVIDSGTSWLIEPDREGQSTKPFWPDPERYAEAVRMFAEAGFACATHATGDRTVRVALDAYASAATPRRGHHRVEHIEVLDDADLERFATEGVFASMQPLHMQWRRGDRSDSFASRLGEERCRRAFRSGDLLRSAASMALGSDWPIASSDPRIGMAWARLRRRPGEPDAPIFEPEQRLTGRQALAGYTTGAARVAGDRDQGRIKVGNRADLSVFAESPVTVAADDLVDLPVLATVVDGEFVHLHEGVDFDE